MGAYYAKGRAKNLISISKMKLLQIIAFTCKYTIYIINKCISKVSQNGLGTILPSQMFLTKTLDLGLHEAGT